MEFLTLEGIEPAMRALDYGAEKYEHYNYYKGHSVNQLVAACMRHVLQFKDGEDLDPESGISHLGHAMACLLMLSKQIAMGVEVDDRYRGES